MPLRIRITSPTAASLRRHASQTVPQARAELADELRSRTLDDVVSRTPVRSGRLRQSWTDAAGKGGLDAATTETDSPGRSVRSATSTVPYAKYVEYGTRRQSAQRIVSRAVKRVRTLAASLFRLS